MPKKEQFGQVTDDNGVVIKYPVGNMAALPTSDIEAHVRQLEGRVLTLIDAVLPEPQQNKATKDIVRGHFKAKMHDIFTDSSLYTGTEYNKNALRGVGVSASSEV